MPVSIKPLPPKDAIAYFRSKGVRTGFAYQDVWQDEHAKAFTVAKMMQVDLLQDTMAAVDKAISEGQTFEQFKKELKPRLQAAGWWGKQRLVDPADGVEKLVQLGSDRRLRTIYQTNLRQAYNVGNWQRAWATRADLPYMVYHHNSEKFPRPEHKAWDLVCLPIEDPWWDTHYPQCAWGCKCTTESVSRRMIEQRGLKVTKDIPTFKRKEYINPRTGEISQVEQGIDPAFNYNAGKSPLRSLTARPKLLQSAKPVRDPQEVTKPFFDALGVADPKAGKVMKDKEGWPLAISDSLFVDASGKSALPRKDLMNSLASAAQAIRAPDKVKWVWRSEIYDAAIDDVLKSAASKGDASLVERLGAINPTLARIAQAEGYAVEDYQYTVQASAVRHIFNEHGDAKIEALRQQLAVTPATISLLPQVLRRPDVLIVGTRTRAELPAITLLKTIGEELIISVWEIHKGKWQLKLKTLFVSPATAGARQKADSVLNVRNGGGATGKVIELDGQIKPARDELVRRYIKRLDSGTVTVDFSAGTWTFDIQP